MKKSENSEEESYALDDSDLPRTMAHVYIAYSALFIIAFSSASIQWLFFSFVYCLSSLTIFSVLTLVFSQAQDFLWKSLSSMIPIALFYALIAYGLLKKKRVASVAALISSLLTIFTDIYFSYLAWSFQDLTFLGIFVSGIVFNVFLVLAFQDVLRRALQDMLRRR